jgi:hypothetical protein
VAATIVIPMLDRGDSVAGSAIDTETMALSCLSPQQAGDIINPYVRSRHSTYYVPNSGISAITVRGTPEELAYARDLIREFDKDPSAACRASTTSLLKLQEDLLRLQGQTGIEPAQAPDKAPTTLLGKPGKSLLDQVPSGSGPVVAPDKATTPPKKP